MISIITPLYKGSRYISALLRMIGECVSVAYVYADVEWIISNDYPKEKIELKDIANGFTVKILNTDINRGIQGARVRGLEVARGEYVLFLDQDDYISPEWIRSQLEHICDADACVCNGTRDGKQFYGTIDRPPLGTCVTREYNISENWGFIPGQVLIRSAAIPELWKNRLLRWNCCDDYLLWILMFAKGCTFAINHDVLYDHRSTGSNQSMNTFEWYKSTLEVIEILEEENILSESEMRQFKLSRQEQMDESFLDKTWCNSKLDILDRLLRVHEKNLKFGDSIHMRFGLEHGIAIYGTGIGWHVYERLKAERINVECFIDQRAKEIDLPVPVYVREEIPERVSLVINTLIKDERETKSYLEENYPDLSVVHIKELLALTLQGDYL